MKAYYVQFVGEVYANNLYNDDGGLYFTDEAGARECVKKQYNVTDDDFEVWVNNDYPALQDVQKTAAAYKKLWQK